jgi:hypothetical protein
VRSLYDIRGDGGVVLRLHVQPDASSRVKRVAIEGVAAADVDLAIGNALRGGVVARRRRSR